MLVFHYTIYNEKRDDYFEKGYTLHLSHTVVHKIIYKFTLLLDFAFYMLLMGSCHAVVICVATDVTNCQSC